MPGIFFEHFRELLFQLKVTRRRQQRVAAALVHDPVAWDLCGLLLLLLLMLLLMMMLLLVSFVR